ncbi:MAG: TIGR02206 family membrane protein [Mycobacteriales bacterium]
MAYWIAVAVGAVVCTALCVQARRRPGRWVDVAGWVLAALLLADAAVFVSTPLVDGYWSLQQSLPLALCDVALVIAALALIQPRWWPLVELTYFWGLAGTLQAVATPDLSVRFPHLVFFEFVTGHLGIVVAALFLVVGRGLRPRAGAVPRVWLVTAVYMMLSGVFDALTGSNYNFLERLPDHGSLLSVLGPWPWYLVAAAGIAFGILVLLDLPFRRPRAHSVGARYAVRSFSDGRVGRRAWGIRRQ